MEIEEFHTCFFCLVGESEKYRVHLHLYKHTFLMKTRNLIICITMGLLIVSCECHKPSILEQKEKLGKLIFFDENLSSPAGQSCATCHDPDRGFADKHARIVSEGAVKGLFSCRNSMTISYAAYVPELHYNTEDSTYVGGLFWDGRTANLRTQAREPFLNPVEMGVADKEGIVQLVRKADYYPLLTSIYGETENIDSLYFHITDAIAAYEASEEINPFSSKFDAYQRGDYKMTDAEKRGLELFKDKALCAECHIMEDGPRAGKPLFTDHTYDNLGFPRNPENPHYHVPAKYFSMPPDSIDRGLGIIVGKEEENGKFRVPTLRNVEKTAPYGHNGYFKTLEEIVHFYNTRLINTAYPAPEYPATVNVEELGDLKLTPEEEQDIVMFLKALTDGYCPEKKN